MLRFDPTLCQCRASGRRVFWRQRRRQKTCEMQVKTHLTVCGSAQASLSKLNAVVWMIGVPMSFAFMLLCCCWTCAVLSPRLQEATDGFEHRRQWPRGDKGASNVPPSSMHRPPKRVHAKHKICFRGDFFLSSSYSMSRRQGRFQWFCYRGISELDQGVKVLEMENYMT